MNLVDRVKNILLTPKTEWGVIAGENTPQKDLMIGYVLPLAAFAAVMAFLSMYVVSAMFGGFFHMSLMWALMMAVYRFIMAFIAVFVIAFIVDALAPSFGGTKNMQQATKVVAYSFTAAWIGSVFSIIPFLGWLLSLLAALYCIYLLYLGLPPLMKNPEDKTIGYAAVVIIVSFVVMIVISAIGTAMSAGGMIGAGMMRSGLGGGSVYSSPAVTVNPKLEAYSKRLDEANKQMEAAQKSGDAGKQMAAAMGAMGAALGGKPGVEPVQLDVLKPFVPETFAGLPRKDMRTERGGVQGLMTAKAEGIYNDGAGKHASLEVVDTGGAAGLMGLAAWMNIQSEREDEYRRESTRKEGNRIVHESVNKKGGNNEFTVVLGQRFIVKAEGNADIDALKSSVASLDLGKLESLN
ncbi:MAG TPA: Yip1 family protein [Usitatibacter sp.]|nr:Yip1 family protein [Usitatibacter sp.]